MKDGTNILYKILVIILIILQYSCDYVPKDVERILEKAGGNKAELKEVIHHYKSGREQEKLKAAYFLIGNMEDKYTLEGEEIMKYDPFFDILDSLNRNKVLPGIPLLQRKWDSLISLKGTPSLKKAVIVPDYKSIKAEYLIENIDLAFKLKEELPWLKNLSFEEFCETLLPYRTGHEPLESWRSKYYIRYKHLRDSLKRDSSLLVARALHNVMPRIRWINLMTAYPFDIPFSKMEEVGYGACEHIVSFDALSYRANGLPVYIDYAPLWGNFNRGHKWTVLMEEDGKHLPIERNYYLDRYDFDYSNAKVYRETYAKQKSKRPDNNNDVPEWLFDNDHRLDVTHEYTRTCDVAVKLLYPSIFKKHYALICSFNGKEWIPQDWGGIKSGIAFFKNMGTEVAYLVMYYEKGRLTPASDPFVPGKDAGITFLATSTDKFEKMHLLRKYPMHKWIRNYHANMLNGKFQGANRIDFKDSVDLNTIQTFPEKIEKVVITIQKKFRFVRYKSTDRAMGDIGELEFFGVERGSDTVRLKGKVIGFPEVPESVGTSYKNVFDGNIETYFNRLTWGPSWAGLDLGSPKRITKIRYCPRSDTNFIVEGDKYELCYWDRDKWISLGVQTALRSSLDYDHVPSGGIYILHNLSRGKEERIFTYEGGKQVFW